LCEAVVKEVDPTASAQVREVVFVFAGEGVAILQYQYDVAMEGPAGIPWK
jgi:hypothetical protein